MTLSGLPSTYTGGAESRYRLIYTLGTRYASWWVFGREAAYEAATEAFHERGIPIAVIETPEDGGLVRHEATVGLKEAKAALKAERERLTAARAA